MEDSVHLLDEEDRGKQKLQEAEEQEENDFQEVQVELQEEDDPTREAKRRVLIVTNGTRGDVQPFVALGLTFLFCKWHNIKLYYIINSTFGCVEDYLKLKLMEIAISAVHKAYSASDLIIILFLLFSSSARALLAENLDVAIATHATFEKWVKEKTPETSFFPLKGDPVAVLSSPELKKALFEGGVYISEGVKQ